MTSAGMHPPTEGRFGVIYNLYQNINNPRSGWGRSMQGIKVAVACGGKMLLSFLL